MTTQINTTPVRIESAKRKITQRLFKNNIPGGNRNPIDALGFNGLTINVKGYARTPEDYDTIVSEILSAPFKIYLKDDWYYNGILADFNVPTLDSLNYYPFDMKIECEEPYMYSDTETTRSKTITANNQEWSADDDGFGIVTNGNVKAVPDIKVTGEITGDYTRNGEVIEETDSTNYPISSPTYVLLTSHTLAAVSNKAYNLTLVEARVNGSSASSSSVQVRYTVAGGGESTLVTWTDGSDGYTQKSFVCDVTTNNNEELVILYYGIRNGANHGNMDEAYHKTQTLLQAGIVDVSVYNIADTTVKCHVSNTVYNGMTVRINNDGTGIIQLVDEFTANTFLGVIYDSSGITYNAGTDDISFADGAYMHYKIDTKYPITGIPTLLSTVDVTAGIPTIQISTDAATWYDIDTSIVDNNATTYPLDNATNLSLKGLTIFYLRFDCGGTGTVTCDLKRLTLNINMVTIDVANPVINIGAANTFKCDQDSDSGMNCEVELIYRDRKWT